MKNLALIVSGLLGLAGFAGRALAPATAAAGRVPVVVELFTSEGCSSCPSADATLRELESSQPVAGAEIIVLGQHVDYWNRLGWKDAFSTPAYTERQRTYAQQLGSGSYTPQAVVQGHEELVGSRRADLLAAIGRAALGPQAQVALQGGGSGQALQVQVRGVAASAGAAQVLLFITESGLATQVGRGENAGRLLQHASVVRSLRPLGQVAPDGRFAATPALPLGPGWNPAHLRAVVLVQAQRTGQVLGVGTLALTDAPAHQ